MSRNDDYGYLAAFLRVYSQVVYDSWDLLHLSDLERFDLLMRSDECHQAA